MARKLRSDRAVNNCEIRRELLAIPLGRLSTWQFPRDA